MSPEYRPTKWSELVGHSREVRRIRRMLETGQLPQALLFAGPDGVGKSSVAELLAAELLQTTPERLVAHPDFVRVEPEGLLIRIGQIREIQRQAGLAASQGSFRVCLLQAAECMEAPAANSLLKILEEPPAGLVFILLTAFPHSLLSTLRSRATLIRFSPLGAQQVAQVLERQGLAAEAAALAASLGRGSCGAALAMSDQANLRIRNQAMDMLRNLPRRNLEWLWPCLEPLEAADTGQVLELVRHWIILLRDLGLQQLNCQAAAAFNRDLREELRQLSQTWDFERISAAIKLAEETRRSLQRNANPRLMLEALLIRSADLYGGGSSHADHCGGPV